ncbi:MAG: IS982 family transposase [Chloroflexi bacterium]|nr:MAG: IS982 family transposase [Chloroflexota bacterium]
MSSQVYPHRATWKGTQMITSFEDFCLWTYVLIDDCLRQWPAALRRPGPPPRCSDAELLTMAVIGECCGWVTETELIARWGAYPRLFPILPERSRFNRRRRQLAQVLNGVRQTLLASFALADDRQCAIDSLPIPVMRFYWVPHSAAKADWSAAEAAIGFVASKRQHFFGYKLHLVVTLGGVIRDFALAPANLLDLAVGRELLATLTDLEVLGDKAYVSRPAAASLYAEAAVRLLTIPRRNQRDQTAAVMASEHRRLRAIIETVIDQLAEQFRIEENHAHSFWGLCTRLYAKLTAHTLCQWLGYPVPVVRLAHRRSRLA